MQHRNKPGCNLIRSGAVRIFDCIATKTIRLLKLFGLQPSLPVSNPATVEACQNEQAGIIRELMETGVG